MGGDWWVGGGGDVFVAEMHGNGRLGTDGGGLAMKGEAGTGSPAEMRWEGRRRERQDVAMILQQTGWGKEGEDGIQSRWRCAGNGEGEKDGMLQ